MVAGAAVNVCSVVAFLLAFFPGHSQTAACGFASLSYMGSCTLSCPQGLIADASSRVCRDVKPTDIHPDGYTVNATKYEAVAFVDDATMMVPGGTYLLTVEVIPTELDTTKVEEFITTINGTGTEMLDFQGALGATTNQVVLRTINPIPPGKHSFTVGLKPFSFDLPGPFTTLDREVELWILPPAQPCSTMLCSNGGQCSDVMIVEVETFSCNCTSGWTGPTCSEDIDFCASQPCMHGGTCIDTGDGYTCMCSHVYTGPDCAAIDYCAVNVPCQNDGHCVNTANTYSCVCVGGWTGKNCTDDVDECTTSDPCVNGVCNNTDGGYGCTCDSGWTGKNCTDDVDECHQLSPCQNGGTCINIDGSYNCSCPPLYTGAHCEEFMPCKSNSCDPTPPSTRTNATPWPTNRIIDTALSAGFVGISIFLFLTISIFACAIGCYRRKRCCCKRRMRTPSSCARPSIHNPAFGTPEAQNWILLEKKMMM